MIATTINALLLNPKTDEWGGRSLPKNLPKTQALFPCLPRGRPSPMGQRTSVMCWPGSLRHPYVGREALRLQVSTVRHYKASARVSYTGYSKVEGLGFKVMVWSLLVFRFWVRNWESGFWALTLPPRVFCSSSAFSLSQLNHVRIMGLYA